MIERLTQKRLTAAAATLFVVGVIAKIPAGVALHFAPDSLQTNGVSGTLWSGEIAALSVNGQVAGPLTWQLKPLSLLTGAIAARVECGLPDGFFAGDVHRRSSTVTITDARLSASLKPITSQSSIGPTQGTVNATVSRLVLTDQWPTEADADVMLRDLQYAAAGPDNLGSYRLQFSPEGVTEQWSVVGQVQSVEAPFTIQGSVSVGDNRSYSIRSTVTPTSTTTARQRNALRILGPAAADGSHSLELDGSL